MCKGVYIRHLERLGERERERERGGGGWGENNESLGKEWKCGSHRTMCACRSI